MMGELRASFRSVRREPWFYSVLLLALVPLFSDYISFPLCLLSFALAAKDAKKHGRHISFGTMGLLMLGYLIYMGCSLLYTGDPAGSFWSLLMWVTVFTAYLAVATVLTDRRRLRTAILCMTVVMGVVGAVAVGQYLLRQVCGIVVSNKLWQGVDSVIYRLLGIPLNTDSFGARVSGTFNNPNLLAAYLVLSMPFSIAFVLTGKTSKAKAVSRMALILAAYALGFSFSRGGYLALLLIGFLLMLLYVRKKFVMTVLTAIYIALLIPPAIGNRMVTVIPHSTEQSAVSVEDTTPQSLKEAIEQLGEDVADQYSSDDSVDMRFVMWGKLLKNLEKNPLFGSGVGVCTTQQTLHAAGLDYKHAHNLFLEILCEGGLISLAFFAAILLVLVKRGWRLMCCRNHTEAALLGFAVLGACMALCVHGVFDFPLLTPRLIGLCMLLMGVSESAARLYLHVAVPEPLSLRRQLRRAGHTWPLYSLFR